MPRVFFIKVLTDLENGPTRVAIDMQDLKDLKSRLCKIGFAAANEHRRFTVARGPRMPYAHARGFPPRSQHGEGQALALR